MPNSSATKTGGVDGRRYIAALAPQNNGRVIGAIIVAQITILGTQQYHAIKGGEKNSKTKGKVDFLTSCDSFPSIAESLHPCFPVTFCIFWPVQHLRIVFN